MDYLKKGVNMFYLKYILFLLALPIFSFAQQVDLGTPSNVCKGSSFAEFPVENWVYKADWHTVICNNEDDALYMAKEKDNVLIVKERIPYGHELWSLAVPRYPFAVSLVSNFNFANDYVVSLDVNSEVCKAEKDELEVVLDVVGKINFGESLFTKNFEVTKIRSKACLKIPYYSKVPKNNVALFLTENFYTADVILSGDNNEKVQVLVAQRGVDEDNKFRQVKYLEFDLNAKTAKSLNLTNFQLKEGAGLEGVPTLVAAKFLDNPSNTNIISFPPIPNQQSSANYVVFLYKEGIARRVDLNSKEKQDYGLDIKEGIYNLDDNYLSKDREPKLYYDKAHSEAVYIANNPFFQVRIPY